MWICVRLPMGPLAWVRPRPKGCSRRASSWPKGKTYGCVIEASLRAGPKAGFKFGIKTSVKAGSGLRDPSVVARLWVATNAGLFVPRSPS